MKSRTMIRLFAVSRPFVLLMGCLAALILFLIAQPQSETAETTLVKYGWTIKEKLAEHELVLPPSFEHQPGDFPLAIYWAYNNELSKEIGLNLDPYLGQPISATLYKLKEELPAFLRPNTEARAVIVSHHGTIVGAWIDRGRHYAFGCSLNRKSFDEITQRKWGKWLISAGVVNPKNEIDAKLATMSPEEIIALYYSAIDRQDFHLAYATFSRKKATEYLFANLGERELFNRAYSEAFADGIENIGSAKLISVKRYMELEPPEYEVIVDMKFKKSPPTLNGDGRYTWFVQVTKEIGNLGWRVTAIGTGP